NVCRADDFHQNQRKRMTKRPRDQGTKRKSSPGPRVSPSDVAAVIVAGGKGLRFGGRVRKQYLLLNGRSVLAWSLSAFEQCPSIFSMVLVVPAADVKKVRHETQRYKLTKLLGVVAGGKTRADSVRAGLAALPAATRYVAVHDAVRPLVKPEWIETV